MTLVIGTDLNHLVVGDTVACTVDPIWVGASLLDKIAGVHVPSDVEIRKGIVGSGNWFNPYPCIGERYELCHPFFPSREVCVIRPTDRDVTYPLLDKDLYPQDKLAVRPIRVLRRGYPFVRCVYDVEYEITDIQEYAFTRYEQLQLCPEIWRIRSHRAWAFWYY